MTRAAGKGVGKGPGKASAKKASVPELAATQLAIDGELTIYRAAELKDVLLAPLMRHEALELDLSGVTEIDTAGVQLLLLAQRTARNQGRSFWLLNSSTVVTDVLNLLNLTDSFREANASALA
jgi:anti-anti-sigma factor